MTEPNAREFADILTGISSRNRYIAWAGYPKDIAVYLKDKSTPLGDRSFGDVIFGPNGVLISLRADNRKRKQLKYNDYVCSEDMAEVIDAWMKYKPRKTKWKIPMIIKLYDPSTFHKTLVVNPDYYAKVTIVP